MGMSLLLKTLTCGQMKVGSAAFVLDSEKQNSEKQKRGLHETPSGKPYYVENFFKLSP